MEKCPSYPKVNELASRIAKVEKYKSSKDPKKPEVGIGDIREILGALADIAYADIISFNTLRRYGSERAQVRRKQQIEAAKAKEEGK